MFDRNRTEMLASSGLAFAAVLGLYLSSLHSYLLFHSLVEISTISIGFTLFILAWNARRFLANDYLKVLGISYAFIAFIDLLHMLAYKGMSVFPAHDANLPTQLWIAARSLQAVALCAAPLFVRRKINDYTLLGVSAAAVGAITATIYLDLFPDCFIEGKGLTPFKIYAEYAISAALLVALALFHWQRKSFDTKVYTLIAASIALTAVSELSFTTYVSVYGFANLLGHFSKLAAFYLIYQALLVTGIREPFNLIFRDLRQTEAALVNARDTLEERVKERTKELRVSEAKYRELIQKIRAAIVLHGPDTRILASNHAAQELLGLSEALLEGKPANDPIWHFYREDGSVMPLAEYPVNWVLATQLPLLDTIIGVRRPNADATTWLLVSADPVFDAKGAVTQVVSTFIDITERKLMQQEMARLASFPVLNPNPIVEIDLNGNVSFANPATSRYFPDIDVRGTNHPWLADWKTLLASCRDGRNDPDTREIELAGRWYQQTLHYVPGEGLRIYGYEITKRKQAEERLHHLNRELRAISDCNQALLRAADEQTLLQQICQIICEQTGYRIAWVGYAQHDDAKTVRPQAWAGVEEGFLANANITWADEERGRGPTGTAIRTGKTSTGNILTDPQAAPWREAATRRGFSSGISLPLKSENGETFGALSIYSATPDSFTPDEIRLLEELAGDLAFGINVLRTRIERDRGEAQVRKLNQELEQRVAERTADLEQVNKELEAFSYSVSHDLRGPLRAINGFSNILQEDYSGVLDAEGQRYVRVIREGAFRMSQLIDDVLAFSRMSRRDMAREPVDMRILASKVFNELRATEPERNIVLHLGDMPPTEGDPPMIRQVLVNLLANAIKFTAPRPEAVIYLSGVTNPDENVYQLRDNGVGFDMRYVDKLFTAFQRLHSADEFEGTGIGLAIVKRIITRHGGRVWAEGAVDQGTTVYFTLPHGAAGHTE